MATRIYLSAPAEGSETSDQERLCREAASQEVTSVHTSVGYGDWMRGFPPPLRSALNALQAGDELLALSWAQLSRDEKILKRVFLAAARKGAAVRTVY